MSENKDKRMLYITSVCFQIVYVSRLQEMNTATSKKATTTPEAPHTLLPHLFIYTGDGQKKWPSLKIWLMWYNFS